MVVGYHHFNRLGFSSHRAEKHRYHISNISICQRICILENSCIYPWTSKRLRMYLDPKNIPIKHQTSGGMWMFRTYYILYMYEYYT